MHACIHTYIHIIKRQLQSADESLNYADRHWELCVNLLNYGEPSPDPVRVMASKGIRHGPSAKFVHRL
jgi:hypothetical protein